MGEEKGKRRATDTERILWDAEESGRKPPWNVTGRLEQKRRLAVESPRGQNMTGPTCQLPPGNRGITDRQSPATRKEEERPEPAAHGI